MSVLSVLGSFFGAVANPISKVFQAKEERKKAVETANAKLAQAKQDSSYKLDLSDSEWEAISKQGEKDSWKDEYVTVIITSPFVLLFIAGMVSGYTGDLKYIGAVNAGIESLKQLDVDLGDLLKIVVLAAVSIKGIGLIRK
jgi:hypothetical protein